MVHCDFIVHLVPRILFLALLALVPALLAVGPLRAGEKLSPASEKLRRYVRLDSSNQSGSQQALKFFQDILHAEGVSTQWIVSPAGVASLYARIDSADGSNETLVLLHHADVVVAGEGWSREPYAGEIADGILYGRGALDAKSLGIAHFEAFLTAHRKRDSLSRNIAFLVVTDEETGGNQGSSWLLEAHPELFEGVIAVLGEGGLNRVYGNRLAWWGVEVAQKRPLWLRVTAQGRPGHGSTLNLHTAPHRLIRALDQLLERPLDFRQTPEVREYLEAIAPLEAQGLKRLVANLDEILSSPHPETKMLPGIPNYFLDSIQVNMLQAGEQPNAAPETASAWIDMRLLPDTDAGEFLTDVRGRLGDDIRTEILLESPQVDPSPASGPGFDCLVAVLSDLAPVIPAFIPGITDSRHFRMHRIPAYGFSPFALGGRSLKGIHGIDEQIPLDAFEQGVETMRNVVLSCSSA